MNIPRPATATGAPLNRTGNFGQLSQLQAAIAGQRNAALSSLGQPAVIQPATAISQPAATVSQPRAAMGTPVRQAWTIIKEVIMANAPAGEEIIVRHAFGGGSTPADTAGNEQVIAFLEAHGPGSIADSAPAAAAGLMAAARAIVIEKKQLPQDADEVAAIISPAGLEHYTKTWHDAISWAKYHASEASIAYALGSAPEAYEQTADIGNGARAAAAGDYVIALSLVTLMSIVSQQAPPAEVHEVETVRIITQPAVRAVIAQANDTQANARTLSGSELEEIVRQNDQLAESIQTLHELLGEEVPLDPATIIAAVDDGVVLGDLRTVIADNVSDIEDFDEFVDAAHGGESISIGSGPLAGHTVARRWNFRGLPATPAGIAAMAKAFADVVDIESIARAAVFARSGPFEITAVFPVFATVDLAEAIADKALELLPPPAGDSFAEVIEQTPLNEDGLSSAIGGQPTVIAEPGSGIGIGSPIRAYSLGVVPGAERVIAALMQLAGIGPSADSIEEVAERIAAGAEPSTDSAEQALAAIAAQMSLNIGPVPEDMRAAQTDISLAELAQAAGFLPEDFRQAVNDRISQLIATGGDSAELETLRGVAFQ